jgi:hypothetical protein
MTKFAQWKVDFLKSWFEDFLSPAAEQFAYFIQACENAIECHEHVEDGGPGSGTGDAAPLTLREWIPDGLMYNLWAFRRLLTVSPQEGSHFTEKTWLGGEGEVLTVPTACDRRFLYVGLETEPARVVKLGLDAGVPLPTTLQVYGTWEGYQGENYCRALTRDEDFLYAAVQHVSARVIKIDRVSLERVSYYIGPNEEQNCQALVEDGKFVYAGMATTPARVRKIRKRNMTYCECWIGAEGEDACYALDIADRRLFVGLSTIPARVVRLFRDDMVTDQVWIARSGLALHRPLDLPRSGAQNGPPVHGNRSRLDGAAHARLRQRPGCY